MSSYSQKNLCWQTTICHPNRGETRLSSPPCFYMVAKTPHTFLTFSNVKSWAQLHTWSCITTQDKLQCFLLHSEYNDVDITHTHTHTHTDTHNYIMVINVIVLCVYGLSCSLPPSLPGYFSSTVSVCEGGAGSFTTRKLQKKTLPCMYPKSRR